MYMMLNSLRDWSRTFMSDKGATAVEYGIMVFLIAVAIILVVTALGGQLQSVFQQVVNALGGAEPATTT